MSAEKMNATRREEQEEVKSRENFEEICFLRVLAERVFLRTDTHAEVEKKPGETSFWLNV